MLRACLFAMLLLAPAVASAQSAAPPIDRAVVDRALAYLNGARSLTAKFVQRDSAGGRWTGRLWLARPGRLRFQYDPPENDVIWSTGGLVKHFDAGLETVTHVPRGATPAWFLLDDRVRIKDDIELLATAEQNGRYFVSAAQSGILTEGRVTLAFQASPERLLGWTVTDQEGAITQVDLIDLEVGAVVEDEIFDYRPPLPEYNDN